MLWEQGKVVELGKGQLPAIWWNTPTAINEHGKLDAIFFQDSAAVPGRRLNPAWNRASLGLVGRNPWRRGRWPPQLPDWVWVVGLAVVAATMMQLLCWYVCHAVPNQCG